MLYGEDEGLAAQIEQLVDKKVRMATDIKDSIDGFENSYNDEQDRHQFVVRLNKLENSLYDFNEEVRALLEGVESNYCGIHVELIPALEDLQVQFEANELMPFVKPFIVHEFLLLQTTTMSNLDDQFNPSQLISVQSLSKVTSQTAINYIVGTSLSELLEGQAILAKFDSVLKEIESLE